MATLKIASRISQAVAATALPIVVLTTLPTIAEAAAFSKLYVFGDSLSDVGNTQKATSGLVPPPPYYTDGRFSNGAVWVEYLAPKLGLQVSLENNFAFGGATTGNKNSFLPFLPGLTGELTQFASRNPTADPDALYILWVGANDYLDQTLDFTNSLLLEQTVNNAVKNISTAVTTLSGRGAKNFLVANLPDLGKLPRANKDLVASTVLNSLSQSHNTLLAQTLASGAFKPDVNLIALDVNALFSQAIADPTSFGFTNVKDACLVVEPPAPYQGDCGTPERYLFWDSQHPTTKGHQKLGEFAYSVLQAKMTPGRSIPETTPVLGLLAVGAFLSRRALQQRQRSQLSRTRSTTPVEVE